MTERLLQYIWQFQHFNRGGLMTAESEKLEVIHPGTCNTNQGPDFLGAKIRIGSTVWAGNIELHIRSSDWTRHKHSTDRNYRNVILHVVWLHDTPHELPFSTLVLEDRVSVFLLEKYDELMNSPGFIPCERNISAVDELNWTSWKERLLVERLLQKTELVFSYLKKNNNHWEESFWWLLARNFGLKVNSDAFEKIAMSLPLSLLSRHKNRLPQLEALLLGQAGLLDHEFEDDYPKLLQKEYLFLKKKYGLKKANAELMFLRMRPSNFPTVRLAQLAMLIHQSTQLFSKICQARHGKEVKNFFSFSTAGYWDHHYVFDVETRFKRKHLGAQMTDALMINSIVPIVFAYGMFHSDGYQKEKALKWLEETRAEKNSISKGFAGLGIANATAFDSQAFIHLKNEYCDKRRCLDCAIGNWLMKTSPSAPKGGTGAE